MITENHIIEQLYTCNIELSQANLIIFIEGLLLYKPDLDDTVLFVPVTHKVSVLKISESGDFESKELLPEFDLYTHCSKFGLNYYEDHNTLYIFLRDTVYGEVIPDHAIR